MIIVGHLIIKKEYIDPFESTYTKHYEIIEIIDIYYYSKRTSTAPYEAKYVLHEFDVIGEDVLKNSTLTVFEYLNLLKKKSKEIQKKFNYITPTEKIIYGWGIEDIYNALGLGDFYTIHKEKYDDIFKRNTVSPY